MTETELIWMDGRHVPWADARVHIMTHSLHYGLGVFEGIRCYNGKNGSVIFRLDEHVERLFNSAHIFQLEIPFTNKQITDAIIETVRVNKLKECYVRPLVYIGYGAIGLYATGPVNVAIAAWPWGTYLGEGALEKGIRVKVSTFTRHHVNSAMTRAKLTGAYFNSQLAKREAIAAGYNEALLLDTEGYVAEGSGENVFMVRKGVIKTTPLTSILEGITRDSIITLAREMGYEVKEERFTRDEMYIADEAFFTGTAAEVAPITELDNRKIGGGKPGPVARALQKAYFEIVQGNSSRHKEWLTGVYGAPKKKPAAGGAKKKKK